MSTTLRDQKTFRVVLHEGEGTRPLESADRLAVFRALLEGGFAVTRSTGRGGVAPADRGAMLVLGRFEDRPPADAEDTTGQVEVRFHDLEGQGTVQVLARVDEARQAAEAAKPGEWKPWFPVIDYDRCTNCMQCLSFCLFGVYGVDEAQRIEVQNNDSCKTNCPACSRVCPEAAIMFPKYKAGPINGDLVSNSDLQREKMKVDISALLGGDVYQLLKARSEMARSRFSKERDSNKALNERQKCLTKLAQAGDIPPEVLMSLPSPDEIERRAREAQAKAAAARAKPPSSVS